MLPTDKKELSPRAAAGGKLRNYFADLHVHLGRSPWGGPIKITAAKNMTLEAVLAESRLRKGIHLVGLVDAQTEGGLAAIEALLARGVLVELAEGGFAYQGEGAEKPAGQDPLTLLPGAEIETVERVPGGGGPAHFLIFVPGRAQLQKLHRWYAAHVTNAQLSSQRAQATAGDLQQLAAALQGLFIPAHVFTPFKSLYGRCAPSWRELLPAPPDAMELGLSSDSALAAALAELDAIPLISSSDAHSLGRIAREYTEFTLARPSLAELRLALQNERGRAIKANYGLDPRLGKYYRSHCRRCRLTATEPPPVRACPDCGAAGRDFVCGVLDRIEQLARGTDGADVRGPKEGRDGRQKISRPPYIHQVPLEFVPGLGPRALEKLLAAFGTEMAVLHRAQPRELAQTVNEKLARLIVAARSGTLAVEAGGGGRYGRLAP